MIRVGIIGASGYTALEAIEWLLGHPQAQILAATSRQADGSMIADMHPSLIRRLKLPVEDLTPIQVAERCDVAFSCLPHGASAHHVMQLLDAGCRVIDLSADYRLSTAALYEKWYGEKHPDAGRLGMTPYGYLNSSPANSRIADWLPIQVAIPHRRSCHCHRFSKKGSFHR